jgi:hypothetical protein
MSALICVTGIHDTIQWIIFRVFVFIYAIVPDLLYIVRSAVDSYFDMSTSTCCAFDYRNPV